jgi:hypothetical protein
LKAKSCTQAIEDDISERSYVSFDLNENEIRDFNKNDRVNWSLFKTNQKIENAKKKHAKKSKGKGKNRMKTDEEAKAKELNKIEKARKKREEQELIEKELEETDESKDKKKHPESSLSDQMIQHLAVDDDFEDDTEVQNAPSTRRAKSQSFSDTKSPFYGDSIFSFSEMTGNKDEKEDVAETINFDVPTKASQLERDMRNMK